MVKSNLKNPGVVTNFIELVAAAYVVPTFDVSTEREPIDAILRVLNDIIDLFCSIHGIKVRTCSHCFHNFANFRCVGHWAGS